MAHLIPFNKQFSTSAELVTLLRSRGLYIEEERKAEDYLDNIGYYRLSACGNNSVVPGVVFGNNSVVSGVVFGNNSMSPLIF